MKVIFESFTPAKVIDGYTFSFTFTPEIGIFWFKGLKNIYFAWLFWQISILLD